MLEGTLHAEEVEPGDIWFYFVVNGEETNFNALFTSGKLDISKQYQVVITEKGPRPK